MDDLQRPSAPRGRVSRVDMTLVGAAYNGDQQALNTLMSQSYPRVLRFLMRLVQDREVAQDLTQETLSLASRRLHQLTVAESFEPWLLRIARNTYFESRDQPRMRQALSLNQLIDQADAENLPGTANSEDLLGTQDETIESYPEREIVQQALVFLTPGQREVILLTHVDGYTGAEMAMILGTTPAAAYQRLHRAHVVFQHSYEQLNADPNHSDGR